MTTTASVSLSRWDRDHSEPHAVTSTLLETSKNSEGLAAWDGLGMLSCIVRLCFALFSMCSADVACSFDEATISPMAAGRRMRAAFFPATRRGRIW